MFRRKAKPMVKTIKKVARREILRNVETKRYAMINDQVTYGIISTLQNSFWMARNPFALLPNGIDSWNVVGSEILDPLLKLKFTFDVNWNQIFTTNSNNYASIALNVYLLASNDDDVATSSWTNVFVPGTEQYNWFYQPNAYIPTFNGSNVKVMKKWRRVVRPDNLMGTGTVQGLQVVAGSMKYRWKRKLIYEETQAINTGGPARDTVFKGMNYFVVVGVGTRAGLGTTTVTSGSLPKCTMDTFMYFKDP